MQTAYYVTDILGGLFIRLKSPVSEMLPHCGTASTKAVAHRCGKLWKKSHMHENEEFCVWIINCDKICISILELFYLNIRKVIYYLTFNSK